MSGKKLEGGCVCGAVRYECEGEGEPVMAAHCHYRDCQKSSGAAMTTVFAVPKAAFRKLQGVTATYCYTGDSGNVVLRHFCPKCGAPLFSDVAVMPELQFVRAASLDAPAKITPSMHVYCDSAQPWGIFEDGLPRFGKMPT